MKKELPYSNVKISPRLFFLFSFFHAVLFLGIGYILFSAFQIFALVHAILGIFVYILLWKAVFPEWVQSIFIGAILSIVMGIVFGDFLLDTFFFLYEEPPRGVVPQIYSAFVVFYIYFYIAGARRFLFLKN